jgi:hypothetical protein
MQSVLIFSSAFFWKIEIYVDKSSFNKKNKQKTYQENNKLNYF